MGVPGFDEEAARGRVGFAESMPDGSAIVTLDEHVSTAPLSVDEYDAEAKRLVDRLFLSKTDTTLSSVGPRPSRVTTCIRARARDIHNRTVYLRVTAHA